MREFNLTHAVGAFSTYTSSLNSLWGLYITATFAAAGFGASQLGKLPLHAAILLTAAYLAFAAGHLRALMANLGAQDAIADEIRSRLRKDPDLTDYPRSMDAILKMALSRSASLRLHLLIDGCVVGVMWVSALFPRL